MEVAIDITAMRGGKRITRVKDTQKLLAALKPRGGSARRADISGRCTLKLYTLSNSPHLWFITRPTPRDDAVPLDAALEFFGIA